MELIGRVRSGDTGAFDVLYARHLPAAKAVAAAQSDNPSDREDVVAEAFASVYQALAAGKGPDAFFRAYLLTAVRRIAYGRNRQTSRTQPTDDSATLDSVALDDDVIIKEFENTAMARAFRTLPERWQAVLWYVDIEGMKPAAASVMVGLSANGVSSLVLRAREGLRRAYLQNHISDAQDDPCARYSSQLGAFARKGLKRTSQEQVSAHLEECAKCTALLADLTDIQSSMRVWIFPLVTGLAFTPTMPAAFAVALAPPVSVGPDASKFLWKVGAAVTVLTGLAVAVAMAAASVSGPAAGPAAVQLAPAESAQTQVVPDISHTDGPSEPVAAPSPAPAPAISLAPAPAAPPLPPAPGPAAPALPTVPALGVIPPLVVPVPVPPVVLPSPVIAAKQTVAAVFTTVPGTAPSDVQASIRFTLQGSGTPGAGEAVFTLLRGAFVPGTITAPAGWVCSTPEADSQRIQCTTGAIEANGSDFVLGISRDHTAAPGALVYQLSGDGIVAQTFSGVLFRSGPGCAENCHQNIT